jgi:hypothetical protein
MPGKWKAILCIFRSLAPALELRGERHSLPCHPDQFPQLLLDGEAGPGPVPEEVKNNPDSRTTPTASSRPGWTGKRSCPLNSERLAVKYLLFLIQN